MSFITPSPYLELTNSYSEEAAIKYMKDVTIMALSQVALYRDLCPISEFKESNVLGLKVPFLKRKSDNVVVNYLNRHLVGAFEMMRQKHLKSLAFLIKDETRTARLESYTLSYSYDSGSPPVSYSTISAHSVDDCPINYVHNSTMDLIMRLEQTLTGLVTQPLPEKFMIDFEVYFCDDAPKDYLPDGYRFQTDEEVHQRNVYIQTPVKFRSGQIKNRFSSITFHTMFAKTLLRENSVETEEDF